MKKISLLVGFVFIVSSLFPQAKEDSIYVLYNVQQKEISSIKFSLSQMNKDINSLNTENRKLSNELVIKQHEIDSLKSIVVLNSDNIKATADELGLQIKETNYSTSKGIA